ncbi:hypothetical protein L7F22_044062 [Adiantum nelumboides]|nr:hypothetical protein [Adiantum nelumboides]
MESYPFIHFRNTSPLTTTFIQTDDEISPSASTSSSPLIPSAKSNYKWIEEEEDLERITQKSWNIEQISTFALISSYFLLNLALTFYNKFIMIDFPFPYFITVLHAGSGTIGCLFLRGIALKTVVTNLLQGGNKIKEYENQESQSEIIQQSTIQRWQSSIQKHAFQYTALELLEVMSPLACVQCLLASQFSGELEQVYFRFAKNTLKDQFNWFLLLLLIGNGFTAFLLNIVSFKTNKVAGPLTMTVVGNLKQVVTILLAFQLFHLQVQSINIIGIIIALFGTAWYGMLEMNSKKRQK